MKSRLDNCVRGALAIAALAVGGSRSAAQMAGGVVDAAYQTPQMPAAPLAGGMAAASGGQFVDAHGNVIPATFMKDCYGGPGGCDPCGDGAGYGPNEWGVDFGGASSPDQCGPHYFDIGVQAVWLQGEDLFSGAPALGSVGVQGPLILDPASSFNDYDPGWQIAARLDFGPLSVLEATYMGIYNLGFNDTIRSVDVAPGGADYQLNSVFSDYGVTPIDGLDEGSVYSLDYNATLQSTELSYRRYWLGYNPRVSGTYLLGFRYVRLAEDLTFSTIALNGNGSIAWKDSNDLLGFQAGGDGWFCLRQGLRIGGEAKAGVYNNRFEFGRTVSFPTTATAVSTNGNQVAFVGEASLDVVADLLPSWSIRGGYRVLYLNNLATAGTNVPATLTSTVLNTESDALFHGFQIGLEYVW
jgi:hypothetical protein